MMASENRRRTVSPVIGGRGVLMEDDNMSKYAKHPIVHQMVDRLHVGLSDADVEADIRSHLTGKATEAQRKAIVRGALERHHENQRLYVDLVTGRI